MFSTADKVKGQGVGSAYLELIKLMEKRFSDEFDIEINDSKKKNWVCALPTRNIGRKLEFAQTNQMDFL